MIYRRCGKSGLLLPALSLGLWQNFGKEQSQKASAKLILTAFDAGITHFDLANNYGPPPGWAEIRFGELFKKQLKKHRDEIIISSKAGHAMWEGPYGDWGSKKHLIASMDQSLKRLKLNYLDIFYSHRPDPHTPLEETAEALSQIVTSGKALYIGLSKYNAEQTKQMVSFLKKRQIPLLIHQYSYSLLNRSPEKKLFSTLDEIGTGGIAFCPLSQGRLSDKYMEGVPFKSRAAKNGFLKTADITPKLIKLLSRLKEISSARKQSLAQMALAWVLKKETTTSALMGASTDKQILENCRTLENLTFSKDELLEINNSVNTYENKVGV